MVEENVSGNNKNNTKVHFDDAINDVHYSLPKTSSSSSASSSNSSLEWTLTDKDNYHSPRSEEELSPNNFHHGQNPGTLMDSTFPYSSTHHAMGRSVGYDPNRIPASVFGKPASPMDWSIASNESLFSIHMGNNSFSRDHNFLLYKSGELTKLDEVFSVPMGLPTVDESLSMPRASNCSAIELIASKACDNVNATEDESLENASRKTDYLEADVAATTMDETNEVGLHTTEEEEDDDGKEKIASPVEHARKSRSLSAQSDGSANSSTSFAFPVLAAQESKIASKRIPTIEEDVSKEQSIKSSQPHSSHHSHGPLKHAKASVTHLFSCFSCCSCRCSLPLK